MTDNYAGITGMPAPPGYVAPSGGGQPAPTTSSDKVKVIEVIPGVTGGVLVQTPSGEWKRVDVPGTTMAQAQALAASLTAQAPVAPQVSTPVEGIGVPAQVTPSVAGVQAPQKSKQFTTPDVALAKMLILQSEGIAAARALPNVSTPITIGMTQAYYDISSEATKEADRQYISISQGIPPKAVTEEMLSSLGRYSYQARASETISQYTMRGATWFETVGKEIVSGVSVPAISGVPAGPGKLIPYNPFKLDLYADETLSAQGIMPAEARLGVGEAVLRGLQGKYVYTPEAEKSVLLYESTVGGRASLVGVSWADMTVEEYRQRIFEARVNAPKTPLGHGEKFILDVATKYENRPKLVSMAVGGGVVGDVAEYFVRAPVDIILKYPTEIAASGALSYAALYAETQEYMISRKMKVITPTEQYETLQYLATGTPKTESAEEYRRIWMGGVSNIPSLAVYGVATYLGGALGKSAAKSGISYLGTIAPFISPTVQAGLFGGMKYQETGSIPQAVGYGLGAGAYSGGLEAIGTRLDTKTTDFKFEKFDKNVKPRPVSVLDLRQKTPEEIRIGVLEGIASLERGEKLQPTLVKVYPLGAVEAGKETATALRQRLVDVKLQQLESYGKMRTPQQELQSLNEAMEFMKKTEKQIKTEAYEKQVGLPPVLKAEGYEVSGRKVVEVSPKTEWDKYVESKTSLQPKPSAEFQGIKTQTFDFRTKTTEQIRADIVEGLASLERGGKPKPELVKVYPLGSVEAGKEVVRMYKEGVIEKKLQRIKLYSEKPSSLEDAMDFMKKTESKIKSEAYEKKAGLPPVFKIEGYEVSGGKVVEVKPKTEWDKYVESKTKFTMKPVEKPTTMIESPVYKKQILDIRQKTSEQTRIDILEGVKSLERGGKPESKLVKVYPLGAVEAGKEVMLEYKARVFERKLQKIKSYGRLSPQQELQSLKESMDYMKKTEKQLKTEAYEKKVGLPSVLKIEGIELSGKRLVEVRQKTELDRYVEKKTKPTEKPSQFKEIKSTRGLIQLQKEKPVLEKQKEIEKPKQSVAKTEVYQEKTQTVQQQVKPPEVKTRFGLIMLQKQKEIQKKPETTYRTMMRTIVLPKQLRKKEREQTEYAFQKYKPTSITKTKEFVLTKTETASLRSVVTSVQPMEVTSISQKYKQPQAPRVVVGVKPIVITPQPTITIQRPKREIPPPPKIIFGGYFNQEAKYKKQIQTQRKPSKQRYGYTPSLTATVFSIRGRVPKSVLTGKKRLTGAEFRPIPIMGKPMRKSIKKIRGKR